VGGAAATCQTVRRATRAEERYFLPRENDRPRPALWLDHELPSFPNFDRIGRTNRVEIWDRAQHGELFDRLVRRAVFTEKNGVVGEDVDVMNMRERGEAQRRLEIVDEVEEGGGKRKQAAVIRERDDGFSRATLG
jgi:hypothetical protein